MKMRSTLAALALGLFPQTAASQDIAGEFDYYVLSLSWSPNWCTIEGDARGSTQCDEDEDFGWIMHGLWPQYERGYPEYCDTDFGRPSRQQTRDMADIMGTDGLAFYQWNKHGVCSGLSSEDYYALAREAYERIEIPTAFAKLQQQVSLPASLIEEAFVQDNPDMEPDGITITCRSGYIQEARICLTRDLEFRTCSEDVVRDCTLDDALLDPIR